MCARQTGKRIVTFAAAAFFTVAAAMAQQQPGTPNQPSQPPMPGQQSPEPGYPNTPEAGNPGLNQPASQSFADEAFIQDTLENSAVEARMSELAENKSPSPDVKQFGQHVVLIHSQLDNQLQPIAAQLGVKEDRKLTKKQKQQVGKLQALSGPAFDQAYIQEMAKDQKRDVKEFKAEADSSQTPAIQQAARMDAPVFQQHLQALQQIAENHNVTIAKK